MKLRLRRLCPIQIAPFNFQLATSMYTCAQLAYGPWGLVKFKKDNMVDSRRCRAGGPHPESLKFPPRYKFSDFCGPLASLAISTGLARREKQALFLEQLLGHIKIYNNKISEVEKRFVRRKGLCGEKVCVDTT